MMEWRPMVSWQAPSGRKNMQGSNHTRTIYVGPAGSASIDPLGLQANMNTNQTPPHQWLID